MNVASHAGVFRGARFSSLPMMNADQLPVTDESLAVYAKYEIR